jgi:hypothetical protein
MRKLFLFVLLLFSFGVFAQSNVNTEIKNDTIILTYKTIVLFDSNDYINMSKEKLFDQNILIKHTLMYQSNNTAIYRYMYFLKPKIQCEEYLNDLLSKCKENYPNSFLLNCIDFE